MTPSERYVAALCERAFLRLWTHPNPLGKRGKELCDCLIVCGPHVVIVSVKECQYKDTGDRTGWDRWHRKAIEASVRQIHGAEKWLRRHVAFTRKDGRVVHLPPLEERCVHRVAVALGGRGEVPLKFGDLLGQGFVHVLDEVSTGTVLSVLDTITDFISFLVEVEGLVSRGVHLTFAGGGVEDLAAIFLQNGRSLDLSGMSDGDEPDSVVLYDDLWSGLRDSADFAEMQARLEASYTWDHLIEFYISDLLTDGFFDFHSGEVTTSDLAIACLAMEPRENRASLAEALIEFLTQKGPSRSAARVALGREGHVYVFMAGPSADREHRARLLGIRCLIVGAKVPGVHTVVGIATDRPGTSEVGYASDIVFMSQPEWTQEDVERADEAIREFGLFKSARWPTLEQVKARWS